MSAARHGLRRRLVAAFGLFAFATALCFSLFSVLFVYWVEDSFFANMLRQESEHQRRSWDGTGTLATPLREFVSVHRRIDSFPADLRRQFDALPRPGEFFGDDGRHYHVRALAFGAAGQPGFLVAQVGGELVVRPRLPAILAFLGLSTLAILAITLALGYWLAQRATEPLSRLAALVSNAAPGQLPDRFADRFPDNEIGLLARNLEQALRRIAAFIAREQHFTRDASHELRTPLAVIAGAAQLLAQQPMTEPGAQQLQRIRSAAAQMEQAVAALLSLAREELDPAAPAPVALLPVIESAIVQFAHLLDGKPVQVEVAVAPDATVLGHQAVLAILLSNLISNAFSHSGQGQIRISFDDACLVVADSGPGIAPALHERMYRPGVKGDASAGFGLGLSIVQRLCERFGLGLAIESAAAGGTRAIVRFTLPGAAV